MMWRSIGLAAGLCAAIALTAAVGGLVFFVSRHRDSRRLSAESAAAEFARARERVAGLQPLVEIRDGEEPIVHRARDAPLPADASSRTLHVLVFDSKPGNLVRIELPFRLVRLMRSNGFAYLGGFTFLEDTEFDADRVRLTLDDLERHGRGLVVDHRHAGGGACLVWVE